MIKCKYAGDPNDSCCVTCNGVDMIETTADGKEISVPCTDCGGYEPEESNETVAPPTDLPWNTKDEEICKPEPVNDEIDTENEAVKPVVTNDNNEPTNNTHCCGKCHSTQNTTNTIEITAGTGISIEIKGVWYKFDYSEKRTVNPTLNVDEQRAELWDKVFSEVDKAVADTRASLGLE